MQSVQKVLIKNSALIYKNLWVICYDFSKESYQNIYLKSN